MNNNVLKKNKIIVGIDLGTTYSLVSTIINNKVYFIRDEKNKYLFPSVVCYKNNEVFVGWDAIVNITKYPKNTITSVKRLIGLSIQEIKKLYPNIPYKFKTKKDNLCIKIDNKLISVIDILKEIFNHINSIVFNKFKKYIYQAVITVPAYFNDIQRKITKKAANLSNINVLRLINEPTAAALSYGLSLKKNGIFAVYDLGGGTFDISILSFTNNIFEVLSTKGNTNLGGDDFDNKLFNFIISKIKNYDIKNIKNNAKILNIAKMVKIKLSKKNKVTIKINNINVIITRKIFNNLISNLIKKTLLICQQAIRDASISYKNIKKIIMVGGSTCIPYVQKKVGVFFNKKILNFINPKKVVAIGASIHANLLSKKSLYKTHDFLLLDVISMSLGIETIGGLFEHIVYKNTTIPVSKTKIFTTFKNNQKTMLIHVLQGNNKYVKNCKTLTKFVIKDLPMKPAGKIFIFVTFIINANGILNINIREKKNNIKFNVKINSKDTVLTKIST
ncbi:Hsp70 family protein [Buchnera aphidicola (Taiwanaphis decaspermi)]|uniref:Hsp70 family protein n=1 Tax=Buchnera aphidicola TaxID=9 RepID=UPI0031B87639